MSDTPAVNDDLDLLRYLVVSTIFSLKAEVYNEPYRSNFLSFVISRHIQGWFGRDMAEEFVDNLLIGQDFVYESLGHSYYANSLYLKDIGIDKALSDISTNAINKGYIVCNAHKQLIWLLGWFSR